MDTYDGDPNLFMRANAGDESLFVVFYMGVAKNEGKSLQDGRPIFDDVEFCRIIIPGDKNTVIDRPATESDRRRFSKQYGLFKEGRKEHEQVSGTRLTDWPHLSRAQCEEFKYLGIITVEQLGEVRDDIVARVPGMSTLKQTAKVWLARSKDTAAAAKQSALMAEQAKRIESLEEVVRQQSTRIEAMLSGTKAKA